MKEMKDSGIEWIGKIPEHWNTAKIKYNFTIISGATPKSEKTEYWNGEINWVTPADFKTDDVYISSGKKSITKAGYDSCGVTLLPINSIIFSKRAPIGNVVISSKTLCINQGCLACVSKKEISIKYFYFAISVFTEQFNMYGAGTTFKEISTKDFSNFILPFPTLKEQQAISAYLDEKCRHIDAIMSGLKKQTELLADYKKSLITETVTKGLNKNVEMKDSGIEWIGEIPKHWNTHPIYCYFSERKNKNSLGLENNLLSLSYGKIVRKNNNSNDGLLPESFNTYNIIEKDDIIIRPTDLQNDKRSLRTAIAREHGIITSAYIAMKAIKTVNSEYFHYLLHTYDIMKVFYNMGNGVRQGLNFSEFSRIMVFEPTIEEQNEIVAFLQEKCTEIDKIISGKKQQIETIEKYKKSLIYECVTGKRGI